MVLYNISNIKYNELLTELNQLSQEDVLGLKVVETSKEETIYVLRDKLLLQITETSNKWRVKSPYSVATLEQIIINLRSILNLNAATEAYEVLKSVGLDK